MYVRRLFIIIVLSVFVIISTSSCVYGSNNDYGIMPIDFDDYNDDYYIVSPTIYIHENDDYYTYDYTIYLSDGKHSGSFDLPKGFHDAFDWFVFYDINDQQLKYVSVNSAKNHTLYFRFNDVLYGSTYRFSLTDSLSSWNLSDATITPYDGEFWSPTESYTGSRVVNLPDGRFQSNSIIATSKDLILSYIYGNNEQAAYSSVQDRQALIAPILLTNTKDNGLLDSFTLRLYDFYTHESILSDLKRNDTLETLQLKVYLKTGNQLMTTIDLLKSSYSIQHGEFSDDIDYPNYINISSGDLQLALTNDYIIEIDATLKSYQDVTFCNDDRLNTNTTYTYTGYYSLTLNTGVGTLVPSDSEGNPSKPPVNPDNPDNPDDGTDKVVDALGGLGNTISDQTSKIEEQTNKIEQTEVQKNIFQQLLDIPGKIIDMLLDLLKSVFIPSDDFFTNWLDDLNDYFGDAFGILYYPFELLIDFLNRVSSLNDTNTAIISIPEFTLSFGEWSGTFFQGYSYDLNSILENETFKQIHDVYLVVVDIILWLGLVYLAAKCINSVIGGMGQAVSDDIYDSQEGERSYDRYKQYQENKERYKRESGS